MSTVNESSTLPPKESGEFIVRNGSHVKVIETGATKCANEIYEAVKSGKLAPRNFSQSGLHPNAVDEQAPDWIFLVDTLNFSFWSGVSTEGKNSSENNEPPKWQVAYKGKVHTGYFALCAGVNRAIDEGVHITNPKVYGSLSADDILNIFRSETSTPIPLVEDRVKNLQEAGRVLQEKYKNSFVNCIKESDNSAQKLLKLIVSDFPSFRDEADFQGKRVSLHKRAQILIGDIWACFEGKGLGYFEDIETLTMFADYRVPQVLLHYGALEYSSDLMELLRKDEIRYLRTVFDSIPNQFYLPTFLNFLHMQFLGWKSKNEWKCDNLLANGDPREVEIRGGSIHAVELVKDRVKKLLADNNLPATSINSILIDHFLWDYRREHAEAMEVYPYHKTRCIYY